jgi:hypothetical protein
MGARTSINAIWSKNMKSTKGTAIITNSIKAAARLSPTTAWPSSRAAPVTVSSWLNITAEHMMTNNNDATVAAVNIASLTSSTERRRYIAASSRAPRTPVAAASVGVAIPSMIRPITMKNTRTDGSIFNVAVSLPPFACTASALMSGASVGWK